MASSDWVNHTHAVMLEADGVFSSLQAGNGASMAFLATGDARDQGPARAAFAEMAEHLEVAKALTRQEAAQHELVLRVEALANRRAEFDRSLPGQPAARAARGRALPAGRGRCRDGRDGRNPTRGREADRPGNGAPGGPGPRLLPPGPDDPVDRLVGSGARRPAPGRGRLAGLRRPGGAPPRRRAPGGGQPPPGNQGEGERTAELVASNENLTTENCWSAAGSTRPWSISSATTS